MNCFILLQSNRLLTKLLFGVGCHAVSEEESGSQLTDSVTSTWYWSPTLQVQGILWRCMLKDLRLTGCQWAVTGVRIGSQMLFWLVSHFPLGSQAVIGELPPLGILFLLTGSLAKLLPAKISGFKIQKKHKLTH